MAPKDLEDLLTQAARARRLAMAIPDDPMGLRLAQVADELDAEIARQARNITSSVIGAMAELEASLISERVTAGMRAAEARVKHLGRPAIQQRIVNEIEALATSTDLSLRWWMTRL